MFDTEREKKFFFDWVPSFPNTSEFLSQAIKETTPHAGWQEKTGKRSSSGVLDLPAADTPAAYVLEVILHRVPSTGTIQTWT